MHTYTELYVYTHYCTQCGMYVCRQQDTIPPRPPPHYTHVKTGIHFFFGASLLFHGHDDIGAHGGEWARHVQTSSSLWWHSSLRYVYLRVCVCARFWNSEFWALLKYGTCSIVVDRFEHCGQHPNSFHLNPTRKTKQNDANMRPRIHSHTMKQACIYACTYRKINKLTKCAWHWWSLGQDNASAIVISLTRMFSPSFHRRLSVGEWNEEHAHGKTTTQSWSPPN